MRSTAALSRLRLRHVALPGLVAGALTLGCSHIPVQMHTEMHIQHADGTVEHKETHWQGTLDQLPAEVSRASKDLWKVTAELIKVLTDVPPPGHIELHDLSPSLAKFEGRPETDFVMQAKTPEGKPIKFTYVRLGVPQFDDFFKLAQEIHALLWQTTQTITNMRSLVGAILDTKIEPGAQLKVEVDKALGQASVDTKLVARLKLFHELAMSLGTLVPELVTKVPKLLTTGEELVKSAPTAIVNPKVLAHLDLVKKGVVDSGTVIKESGEVLVRFAKDLTGYGKERAALRQGPPPAPETRALAPILPATIRRRDEG